MKRKTGLPSKMVMRELRESSCRRLRPHICVAPVRTSVTFLLVLLDVRPEKVDWPTVRILSD